RMAEGKAPSKERMAEGKAPSKERTVEGKARSKERTVEAKDPRPPEWPSKAKDRRTPERPGETKDRGPPERTRPPKGGRAINRHAEPGRDEDLGRCRTRSGHGCSSDQAESCNCHLDCTHHSYSPLCPYRTVPLSDSGPTRASLCRFGGAPPHCS